ncbi:MAG: hypothetical protein EZS28_024419 [Streblomastix strix]|uniref:Uncharacterized protein n=1 Tax=Streblomastix strix TaxID=222440 RepID=A0A5J4VBZ8_9EUKA|nr:MAG: hypothetical protein EZS28_024419 [Streblomastix strix]
MQTDLHTDIDDKNKKDNIHSSESTPNKDQQENSEKDVKFTLTQLEFNQLHDELMDYKERFRSLTQLAENADKMRRDAIQEVNSMHEEIQRLSAIVVRYRGTPSGICLQDDGRTLDDDKKPIQLIGEGCGLFNEEKRINDEINHSKPELLSEYPSQDAIINSLGKKQRSESQNEIQYDNIEQQNNNSELKEKIKETLSIAEHQQILREFDSEYRIKHRQMQHQLRQLSAENDHLSVLLGSSHQSLDRMASFIKQKNFDLQTQLNEVLGWEQRIHQADSD